MVGSDLYATVFKRELRKKKLPRLPVEATSYMKLESNHPTSIYQWRHPLPLPVGRLLEKRRGILCMGFEL